MWQMLNVKWEYLLIISVDVNSDLKIASPFLGWIIFSGMPSDNTVYLTRRHVLAGRKNDQANNKMKLLTKLGRWNSQKKVLGIWYMICCIIRKTVTVYCAEKSTEVCAAQSAKQHKATYVANSMWWLHTSRSGWPQWKNKRSKENNTCGCWSAKKTHTVKHGETSKGCSRKCVRL